MRKIFAAALVMVSGYGCSVIGPSCVSQKHTGTVTSFGGQVAAGATVSTRVPYGTQGSQNDLTFSWSGKYEKTGPQLRFYATRVGCDAFTPGHSLPQSDVCASIGSMGGILSPNARACAAAHICDPEEGDIMQTTLGISNGHGNPDQLGNPAEYLLWVVGDPEQAASYAVSITWFYGPDC
jgi:hypothetical protein